MRNPRAQRVWLAGPVLDKNRPSEAMRKLVIGTVAVELFPLMVPKAESCNAFEAGAIVGRPIFGARHVWSNALASASHATSRGVAKTVRLFRAVFGKAFGKTLRKMVCLNTREQTGLHNAY